jgi:hypothetical protein
MHADGGDQVRPDEQPLPVETPVRVADILGSRGRDRHSDSDGWLSSEETARAWPVVWNVPALAEANGAGITPATPR